ncbi:MAG TPA: cytochrome c [Gemmatimonadaceae bacterium]|nr:cytochrome c [Gemmatimonadaceae bacterium]
MTAPQRLARSPRRRVGTTRILQLGGIAIVLIAVAAAARQPATVAGRRADPTFAQDVAPIFYKNCTACHHTGGLAPFSLVEYDSATPYLSEMYEAVSQGKMPPWHAEGPHGMFRNDRRLSDADKATILKWLDTGAKPGDLSKLPPRPTYPSTWTMAGGPPDLVVSMKDDFEVPATGTVEYQYFEIPTNITEEKWVQAIEIQPGAREVVHHVLVYAKVPPPPAGAQPAAAPAAAGTPQAPRPANTPLFVRNRDQGLPPDPPRLDTLHPPPRQLGPLIGSTAPGTNVVEFPAGTALRLRPGTILTFQMHYTTHGEAHKDRTSVGFRFAKEMPDEEIYAASFVNGAFTIPAGAKDVAVPAEIGVTQPVKIWGLLPHTHLRGVRWQYKLVKPDSTSEIILDVPRYDFNWQTYYLFAKPLEIPTGAKITSMAWYDNSSSNKSNPNPSVDVKWGDQTWEEMQYTGFLYSVPSRRLRPAK